MILYTSLKCEKCRNGENKAEKSVPRKRKTYLLLNSEIRIERFQQCRDKQEGRRGRREIDEKEDE